MSMKQGNNYRPQRWLGVWRLSGSILGLEIYYTVYSVNGVYVNLWSYFYPSNPHVHVLG